MTSEDMERALEFLIKQQGQFTTDLGRLENTLETVVNVLAQVADNQLKMAEAQAASDARIAQLAEAQKRTTEAQERTDHAMAETNDRLNSLIVVVERYFSNGRGRD
jgi:two-component sensor histidine kinase